MCGDAWQTAYLFGPPMSSQSAEQDFPLGDAHWHHVALTTFPQGGKGFQLYIDGRAAAEMNPNNTYAGEHLAGWVAQDAETLSTIGSSLLVLQFWT